MNPLLLSSKPVQKPLAVPLKAKDAPQNPPIRNNNDIEKANEKPVKRQDNIEFADFLPKTEPDANLQNIVSDVAKPEIVSDVPKSEILHVENADIEIDGSLQANVVASEQDGVDVNAVIAPNLNVEVKPDNNSTIKPTHNAEASIKNETSDLPIANQPSRVQPQVQGETAPVDADDAKNLVLNVIDKLKSLAPEALQKIGVSPNEIGKITNALKNLVADINNNGLSADSKNIVAKLQTILQQVTDAKSVLNGFANASQKLTPDDVEAIAKLFAGKDVETRVAEVKSAEKTIQTQNDAPMQKAVIPNKYAGRYDAANGNADNIANADGEEAKSQARTIAVYDSAKSALTSNQATPQTLSSLDRVVEQSPLDFLNQIKTNASGQSLLTDGQDNNIVLKLATQNGRLPQNLPLNSLAFQISKQFNKGGNEFQIRLDPAELGRININLSFKKGGSLKAHMVVERSDVFELLQRDARALERALSEAGFEGENIEVEFSLDKNANDNNNKSFNDEVLEQNDNNNKNSSSEDEEIIEMTAEYIPLHVRSTSVDRKI